MITNACVARPLKAGAARASPVAAAARRAMADAEEFQRYSVWVGSLRAGTGEKEVADFFFWRDLTVEDVRVTENGVLDWYAHVTFLYEQERWDDN